MAAAVAGDVMATRFVEESCRVEIDECDGCGATERIEAFVGSDGEAFDPRGRSQGFSSLRLWSAHPWYDKSVCHECRVARVFEVDGIPARVPNMVRIRTFGVRTCSTCDGGGCDRFGNPFCQQGWVYNERGLRLPSAPPGEEELEQWGSALAIVGDRAVVLNQRCGYWVPTTIDLGRDADQWLVDLIDGERVVVLCEPTSDSFYPNVLEPIMPPEGQRWANSEEHEWWGAEVCRRMVRYGDVDGGEAVVVKLRVPTEILQ